MDITVKTLDSRNHFFTVAEDMTVKQFKEHIAETVNVPVESQRLIYCGKVLVDDKKLTEYDVKGKVIHLAQRAPPNMSSSSNGSTSESRSTSQRRVFRAVPGRMDGSNAMYLGAMAFPADLMDAQGLTMPLPRPGLSTSRLSMAKLMLQRARSTLESLERNESPQAQSSNSHDVNTRNDEANTSANIQEEFCNLIRETEGEGVSGEGPIEADAPMPQPEGETSLGQELLQVFGVSLSPGQPSTVPIPLPMVPVPPQTQVNSEPLPNGQDAGSSSPEEVLNNISHEEEVSTSETNARPNDSNTTSGSTSGTEARRYASTTALAEVIGHLKEINHRLVPFLVEYHNLLSNDSTSLDVREAQLLFNQVSEVMHSLSHAYHALSDIMCDFSDPHPRFLRCRPVIIQHSAVLQTSIPIQAQMINLSTQTNISESTGNNAEGGSQAGGEGGQQSRPAAAEQMDMVSDAQLFTSLQNLLPSVSDQAASNPPSNTTSSTASATAAAAAAGATAVPPPPPTSNDAPPTSNGLHNNIQILMDVGSGPMNFNSEDANFTSTMNGSGMAGPFPLGSGFIRNLFNHLVGEAGANNNNNNNNNNNQTAENNNGGSGGEGSQSATEESSAQSSGQTRPPSGDSPSAQGGGQNRPTPGGDSSSTPPSGRHSHRPLFHFASSGGQGLEFFDPFLPCNSHHIRRRNRSGNESSQVPGEPQSRRPPRMTIRRIPAVQRQVGTSANRTSDQTNGNSVNSQRPTSRVFETIKNGTLKEMITCFSQTAYISGKSLIMDMLVSVGKSVLVSDIFASNYSNIISNIRVDLKNFINEGLGVENSSESFKMYTAVEGLIISLRPFFNAFCKFGGENISEECVDFISSMNIVTRHYLPLIIKEVLDADQSSYVVSVMDLLKRYIGSFINIMFYNFGHFNRTAIINEIASNISSIFLHPVRAWLEEELVRQLQLFSGDLNGTLDSSQRNFLVYMPQFTQQVVEVNSMDDVLHLRESSSTPLRNVIGDTDQWRHSVPSEWVPVITKDKERQRRAAGQGPFSESYLAGMPSKRRKVITETKPLGTLSKIINESMSVALNAAGVEGSCVAVVAESAASDTSLRSAYKQQVKTSVETTLRNHPDYHPDKYPNCAKYFHRINRQ